MAAVYLAIRADGQSRNFLLGRLSQPQVFERRVRVSTANVGDDHQLQNFHTSEINLIVFDFACRLRGTEIPLLPHDFAKALIGFRAPTKNKFLRATGRGFVEHQTDSPELLRLIEDKTDGLPSRARSAPPLAISRRKRGFDRMSFVLDVSSRVAAVSRFNQAWSEKDCDSEIVRRLRIVLPNDPSLRFDVEQVIPVGMRFAAARSQR
jgi:hypothetical protein